jgi:hypothetical protein
VDSSVMQAHVADVVPSTKGLADAIAVLALSSDDKLGIRCSRDMKSSKVFNYYLDCLKGEQRSPSSLRWYLHRLATVQEYEDWERNMELGFARCRTYKKKFNSSYAFYLAIRRVDEALERDWQDAVERGEFAEIWEDYKIFLRSGFVLPYVEESVQPSKVVHTMKEVDKCIVPIQEIVPLPTITKVKVKS